MKIPFPPYLTYDNHRHLFHDLVIDIEGLLRLTDAPMRLNGGRLASSILGDVREKGIPEASPIFGHGRVPRGAPEGRCKRRGAEIGCVNYHRTMSQNREKHRINNHLINHCPTSEGVSEVSERANE